MLDKRLNGNFSHLKNIIENGRITSKIAQIFPLEAVIKPNNFISLLYYFGLLTHEKDEDWLLFPQERQRT